MMAVPAIVRAGGALGGKLVEAVLRNTDDQIVTFIHGTPPQLPPMHSARVVWQQLELDDTEDTRAALNAACAKAVINAAAMTNVDARESRPAEAWTANAEGLRILAKVYVELGARLIQVSTDYVFPGDGENLGPYTEYACGP